MLLKNLRKPFQLGGKRKSSFPLWVNDAQTQRRDAGLSQHQHGEILRRIHSLFLQSLAGNLCQTPAILFRSTREIYRQIYLKRSSTLQPIHSLLRTVLWAMSSNAPLPQFAKPGPPASALSAAQHAYFLATSTATTAAQSFSPTVPSPMTSPMVNAMSPVSNVADFMSPSTTPFSPPFTSPSEGPTDESPRTRANNGSSRENFVHKLHK
ncbi:hypothetical protein DFS34DRAFT_453672 [Phlyctochytrium arcticum]|nr:hypothetical protein DFS34DRAFT_453672 [Phlyctochytrium arcticum]